MSFLTKEVLERFQATDQLASLVVSVPGTVEGILAWSMYVEQEDGTFRVHLRSKGPTVNYIAQKIWWWRTHACLWDTIRYKTSDYRN